MERESFERNVLDRLIKIETKLDNLGKIEDQSSNAYNLSKENEKEIEEIKDKLKWLARTVTASIISIVIGAIVYVIKLM